MGPEGDDGIIGVPDEDDCLAVAKGQVRHPKAGRLPSPVPLGDLVGIQLGVCWKPFISRVVLLLNRLPVVWFLGEEYRDRLKSFP